MDEITLAEAVADALATRLGTHQVGRLIGLPEAAPTAPVDLTQLARPWKEGDIYEMGAVANHWGGLWQARQRTATRPPGRIGEWGMLADGIRSVHAILEGTDPRAFNVVITLASGDRIDLPVRLPLPLHRGVYVEGGFYGQGDEVEWQGATYRAVHNAPGPPDSDGWRLVSARGLQGDRGEQGEPGERGDRGEVGPQGNPGVPGTPGERGIPGPRGVGIHGIEAVRGYPGSVRIVLEDGTVTDPVEISSLRFVGLYQPGASYQRGEVVRLGFHLWVCVVPTDEVPSNNSQNWALFLPGVDPGGSGGGGVAGGGITEAEADARYLQLAGGLVTGTITLPTAPGLDTHATNKGYVDSVVIPLMEQIAALRELVESLQRRVASGNGNNRRR